MAVVIPAGRYETMERSRERLFDLIERNWERNKDIPYEEVQREVEQAIRGVRGQRGDDGGAA